MDMEFVSFNLLFIVVALYFECSFVYLKQNIKYVINAS